MSDITMHEMLKAGVHFGHQARYWNPHMAPYLFGQRNKIHIINLEKSLPMYRDALNFLGKLAAKKGKIWFVGTKRSAGNVIQEEALRCDMPFVNNRWMGGLITNYRTVKQSIRRMKSLEEIEEKGAWADMTKKEQLRSRRELNKLARGLAGIKHMDKLPDALFIIDVGYERIAVSEANKLGIPIVGVVDSNNSPQGIDYVIPGNDDAISCIRLYAKGVADAIIDGHVVATSEGNADDFVEINALNQPIDSDQPATKKRASKVATDKTQKTKILTKKSLRNQPTQQVASTTADTNPSQVAEQDETGKAAAANRQESTSSTVKGHSIIRVKQQDKSYREGSDRALWWERIKQFDNQSVDALKVSIDADHPSQPSQSQSTEQDNPYNKWLSFFKKYGLIEVVQSDGDE